MSIGSYRKFLLHLVWQLSYSKISFVHPAQPKGRHFFKNVDFLSNQRSLGDDISQLSIKIEKKSGSKIVNETAAKIHETPKGYMPFKLFLRTTGEQF